jgi:hypothetical protein
MGTKSASCGAGDRVVGFLSWVRPLYFSPVEHSRRRNSKQVMQITTVLRSTESSLRDLVVMCCYLRLTTEDTSTCCSHCNMKDDLQSSLMRLQTTTRQRHYMLNMSKGAPSSTSKLIDLKGSVYEDALF